MLTGMNSSVSERFRFSNDTAEIDRARVHGWLSELSYWAKGRVRQVQDAAIDGSRNYGVFRADDGAQVGYARVVTDQVTFSWLCDVFVDPSARGAGVGKYLVESVLADLDALGLPRVMLATGDAHGLYERYGFAPLAEPGRWLLRQRVPGAAGTAG